MWQALWQTLYILASPKTFYRLSGRLLPYLRVLAAIFLLVGLWGGLYYAPADYQQGDAFRIIYIHVPAAFLSLTIYSLMSFCAVLFLVWRIKLAGLVIKVAAPLGASVTLLALVSGSIWGKPMWGTWWVWDARLTSELILLFIYIGLMALSQSMRRQANVSQALAIMTLIGLVDIPIIHFSVEWWHTLHQGSTLSAFAKPKMSSDMLYPLLLMISAVMTLVAAALLQRLRIELLLSEKKSRWVQRYVQGDDDVSA